MKREIYGCELTIMNQNFFNINKINPKSLLPYLFPNTKMKMSTRKLARISQIYYDKICGIFIQHYTRLRTSYKNLCSEMKKHKDGGEYEQTKIKFKLLKLEEDLFSIYDSDSSDENDSDSISENSSS